MGRVGERKIERTIRVTRLEIFQPKIRSLVTKCFYLGLPLEREV